MIELVTTVESIEQAKALLNAGADTLYVGEDLFGLRLPHSFSRAEIEEITKLAHDAGKRVCVAVNGIMHNDRIEKVPDYLHFLEKAGVDEITVGDPGVIHLMQKQQMDMPFIYDAQTLVTSARQINFWAKRGAVGAVLARELTFEEIREIQAQVAFPLEVLVYGATCIHHSKRPLLENYFHYTEQAVPAEKGLFLSEPKQPDTHYSIYEDMNGTHVFLTDDMNLLPYADELAKAGMIRWKLDGIFSRGENFVSIVRIFSEAKKAIEQGRWTYECLEKLNGELLELHPKERTLGIGFFLKNADEVK